MFINEVRSIIEIQNKNLRSWDKNKKFKIIVVHFVAGGKWSNIKSTFLCITWKKPILFKEFV